MPMSHPGLILPLLAALLCPALCAAQEPLATVSVGSTWASTSPDGDDHSGDAELEVGVETSTCDEPAGTCEAVRRWAFFRYWALPVRPAGTVVVDAWLEITPQTTIEAGGPAMLELHPLAGIDGVCDWYEEPVLDAALAEWTPMPQHHETLPDGTVRMHLSKSVANAIVAGENCGLVLLDAGSGRSRARSGRSVVAARPGDAGRPLRAGSQGASFAQRKPMTESTRVCS